MRVLHLADLHLYLSGPRAEECRRVIDWIALHAREVRPTLIVVAGDLYERRSSPQERIYFAELMCVLSDIAPVYIINGNHDDVDDLRLFRREYGWIKPIQIVLEPEVLTLTEGRETVTLAFLPWPNLANLAKAGAGESIEARREAARAALLDVVRGFRVQGIEPDKPSLLVAHLPVSGATMDSGQPVCGGDEISLTADELLESGAAAVALGHIHLRQQMRGVFGRPVWYAGAPFRGSFGEAKGTKGGLIWDWDHKAKAWEVAPWEVPARSMVLIERTWLPPDEGALPDGAVALLAAADDVRDADVRVRITFPAESREAMRAAVAPALDELRAAAHAVTVEERAVIVSRTRCVEITAARTTLDKLRAWGDAVGAEIPDGAVAKLATLETEVLR